MKLSTALLSITSAALGLAFAYTHAVYWIQPGNCSPCRPEYFAQSIVYGAGFLVVSLIIWLTPQPEDASERQLVHVARVIVLVMLASLAASLLLFGLFWLPLAATAGAVANVFVLARSVMLRFRRTRDHEPST